MGFAFGKGRTAMRFDRNCCPANYGLAQTRLGYLALLRKLLPKLIELIATWAFAIWLTWNSGWVARQIVEHIGAFSAFNVCIGWLVGLSAAAWPLALEVAVERWHSERGFDQRVWILFMAGGITLLGIGTIALGLIGGTLDPKASTRIYTFGGLILGALTGALWWLLHFIHKGSA